MINVVLEKKKGRRGIREETKEHVLTLYNEDRLTCAEIAKVCGISRASVFRIISERRQLIQNEET